jgi:hypothetical protein
MKVKQEIDISNENISREIEQIKQVITELKNNELQSEKLRYQKNYQLVLYGIEIINEINQGTIDVTAARSQNILNKKMIDINNPSSEVAGFQLMNVIDKAIADNISLLPLADKEKSRLRGQVSNFVEGVKKIFPPVQIITGVVSMLSSFTTYQPKIEKLSKRTDSLIVDISNPVSKEILSKINNQLAPYVEFYQELNKINASFENALYQHVINYRDFIEEVVALQKQVNTQINPDYSIGEQINKLFDLENSSSIDFNFKMKNDDAQIKELAGNCINIYSLVDRYKKFINDFIVIQDDFYANYIFILDKKARQLPYKDDSNITKLIEDITTMKNGSDKPDSMSFSAGYKQKIKSITAKIIALNRTRF